MSDGRLRILFVTARYLPSVGGMEIHVHEVGKRVAAAGHHVKILTVDATRSLERHEWSDGMEVVRVPAWPKRGDYLVSPGIFREVRHAHVDVVHCHGYYTFVGPFAMAAALRARLPYLLTFHGRGTSSRLHRKLRRPQELALRPLLVRAAHLVVLSQGEREFYRRTLRLPASQLTIVPGGANLAGVDDLPEVTPDANLIVSLGRADELKGHQKIVAALPEIARVRPQIRLRICGDGPYAQELRRLSERLNVSARVEIAGIPFQQRDEFIRTVQSAALVVTLSDSEAQGLAALEAAFLGRPLLVSDTSALVELVDAGIAAGVPPDASPSAVAEAALGQLEEPMAPRPIHLPTWDECAERLEELYRAVARAT
jgi:glycosyltransferase involved in cell wall biosynthesis